MVFLIYGQRFCFGLGFPVAAIGAKVSGGVV